MRSAKPTEGNIFFDDEDPSVNGTGRGGSRRDKRAGGGANSFAAPDFGEVDTNRNAHRGGGGGGGYYQNNHEDYTEEDEFGVITAPLSSAVAAPLTVHDLSNVGGGFNGSPFDARGIFRRHNNDTMNNTHSDPTNTMMRGGGGDFGFDDDFEGGYVSPLHQQDHLLVGGNSMIGGGQRRGPQSFNPTPTSMSSTQYGGGGGGGGYRLPPDHPNSAEQVAKRLKELEDDLFMRKDTIVPIEEDAALHFRQVAAKLQEIPRPPNASDPPWWLPRHQEATATLRRPYAEDKHKTVQSTYQRAFGSASDAPPPTADFRAAFDEEEDEDDAARRLKPRIIQDPVPNSVGMLRGHQDLALPPPANDGSPVKGGRRSARHSIAGPQNLPIFGGKKDKDKDKEGVPTANFETDDGGLPFAVERSWRDKEHVRLQQTFYPPLRPVTVVEELGVEDNHVEFNEVLRKYRTNTIQASAYEEEKNARTLRTAVHADGGTFVPFTVRPMGISEVQYTSEDAARRADNMTENNRRRAVEEALDVATSAVVAEPFRPPPHRNLRDEEEAKRQLIAFDDDDPFTFQARRLKNADAIEELFQVAAHETVEKAEVVFQEAQEKRFAAVNQHALNANNNASIAALNNGTFANLMNNANHSFINGQNGSFGALLTNGSFGNFKLDTEALNSTTNNTFNLGGGADNNSFSNHLMRPSPQGNGGGADFVPLREQFANTLANNALLPHPLVIGDSAFIFAFDFSYAVVFRPAERTAYSDEWKLVPLSCDAVVTDMFIGSDKGGDGNGGDFRNSDDNVRQQQKILERLQRRRERQNRRHQRLINAQKNGGMTQFKRVAGGGQRLVDANGNFIDSTSSSSDDDDAGDRFTAANTVLIETPQLPMPNSIPIPLFHPTLKEVLIVISPDNRIYGCCVGPRPMQGYVGGCWKYIRLVGLELGGGGGIGSSGGGAGIIWAHLVDPTTIYARSVDKHFTVSIEPLLEELTREHAQAKDVLGIISQGAEEEEDEDASSVKRTANLASRRQSSAMLARRRSTAVFSNASEMARSFHPTADDIDDDAPITAPGVPAGAVRATPRNIAKLKIGNPSTFGGIIMDYMSAATDVRVKMLKSTPPEEKLVALPYPGVAYTTHQRERRDKVTGELMSEEAYQAHDVFARQQARVAEELRRVAAMAGNSERKLPVGINIFSKYSNLTQQKAAYVSPSRDRNAINKEDEEIGEYYYDYTLGRYVRKQQNVRNRNILLTEAHTWIWLYNPAARNFLPWQRLDGLFDPLPVMLHNHLKGPEEVATLAGDAFTTFMFGEELLQVSRDLNDARSKQEFLRVMSKICVREAPPPQQIALYEVEKKREEMLSRTKAAGGGTRMSEMHIREQMRIVKEERLKAAHAAGRKAAAKERNLLGGLDAAEEGVGGDDGTTTVSDGLSTINTRSYMGKLGPQFLTVNDDEDGRAGGEKGKGRGGGASTVLGSSESTFTTAATAKQASTSNNPNATDKVEEDPFVAAAKALAAKPLQERITAEPKLSKLDRSLHIKTRRKDVALAIPMSNRRAAILASDFKTYVVVELDRYAHAVKYRDYGKARKVIEHAQQQQGQKHTVTAANPHAVSSSAIAFDFDEEEELEL